MDQVAVLAGDVLPASHRIVAATTCPSALDDYRVMAQRGDDGDVLVTGLPMRSVDTVHRLMLVEAVVFASVLAAAGAAAAMWSLRPLRRVAATASRVAELPLASGEVAMPERVPDIDPRTEVGLVGAALNRMLGHVENALARRKFSGSLAWAPAVRWSRRRSI